MYVGFVPKSTEILVCVLREKNPKTEQATVMDKYSSGIQEKCKDASQVGFHLLVMIPSSVTGSKTQPANSPLLPPMPEQKACFLPRSVLPGKLSAWVMDFIIDRNCARALTLQVDDDHSMGEGAMVEGISTSLRVSLCSVMLLLMCRDGQGRLHHISQKQCCHVA